MKFYNILIAGDDDNMWQSEIAAENIYNKRPKILRFLFMKVQDIYLSEIGLCIPVE